MFTIGNVKGIETSKGVYKLGAMNAAGWVRYRENVAEADIPAICEELEAYASEAAIPAIGAVCKRVGA